jgi:hypothetical protein
MWGFDMAADRHGPREERDLWVDMGRLWACIDRTDLLATFLKMVVEPAILDSDEGRRVDMESWAMGSEPVTGKPYRQFVEENASAWRDAWNSAMGDGVVIRTSDRWDGMVKHLGYRSTSINYSVADTLSRAILTDKNLVDASQERLRETEVIPDDCLTPVALAHLNLARAIAAEFHGIAGVHASVIPPASDRVRTAGLYIPATREIILHLEVLEHAKTTIDAMVHEIGHHKAHRTVQDPAMAEDLQPAHSEAMTAVAALVVKHTSHGRFDELLKGARW